MAKVIKIKKGLDIAMKGKAEKHVNIANRSQTYAVKPTDFAGLTPKVHAKAGTVVKAGDTLFYDKYRPEVVFTAPVSGKLSAVNRGFRRKILEFVIEPDKEIDYAEFTKADPESLSPEEIKENLLKSGCWPYIRQRPFNIIADTEKTPRDIFITTFDSAPLAPDYELTVKEDFEAFQTGINALRKLTKGNVYLGLKANSPTNIFANTAGVEKYEFDGPHPAGNVGVQINKVKPVNINEIVWTLSAPDVVSIGRLFMEGKYDASRIVAVTGSEIEKPAYFKIIQGAEIKSFTEKPSGNESDIRYISGNVLSGEKVNRSGYLGFYDYQLTAIPEGNEGEVFGWAMPGLDKFSVSRAFFTWLNPKKERVITTKLHGMKRPFIQTGEIEKVFPMDIYPMQLLKAVKYQDLDQLEQLGIYEVAEEDFALCEVVNSSKIEMQKMIREGFEFMIKELG